MLRFGRDRQGNFAIISAVLAVPLVMSAGAMLDLSTISRTKAELQNALDAAALAVAREGKNVSDTQAREIAVRFMQSNLDPSVTQLDLSRTGSNVRLAGATKAKMAFGGLLGYKEWPISAAAEADVAFVKYEIGLVLDTTGSMAGGKLQAMKDAVNGLVDTMSAQVRDPEDLKFSLVPFSTFVNVGAQFGPKFDSNGQQVPSTGASWLDIVGVVPVPQTELVEGVSRFQLAYNTQQPWSGCVESRVANGKDFDVADTLPVKGEVASLVVPAFAIDEPDIAGYFNSYINATVDPKDKTASGVARKLNKYGVPENKIGELLGVRNVASLLGRDEDDDDDGDDGDDDDDDDDDSNSRSKTLHSRIAIDNGVSNYSGYRKGPNFGCVSRPIMALTDDYASVKREVNALEARGNTNILEGVVWGMRALSPGEPFTEGAEPSAGLQKIMIVLTDGANTLGTNGNAFGSVYSSFGYLADGRLGISSGGETATNVAMNAKTLKACENAKRAGIEVYTIRLEEPDVKTGTMLQGCASSPDHYSDAPSRTQLDEIFRSIRTKIVRVRLSS